jgi:hypothetical protein
MHSKGWYICTNRCEATVRDAKHLTKRQCRGSVVGKRDGLELCWVHFDREVEAWPNPQRRDPN